MYFHPVELVKLKISEKVQTKRGYSWKYNGRERPRSLTDDRRLQVHKDGPGNMFPSSGLAEERVEGVVSSSDRLVAGHLTVRLDAMLQAVELPACIANLSSGLADVDRDTLSLCGQALQVNKPEVLCRCDQKSFN